MNYDDDTRERDALFDLAAGEAPDELDPNDLAHLVAGTPGPETRTALQARLARARAADHRTIRAVAEECARRGEHARVRRRPGPLVAAAVAAAVLVGIFAWRLAAGRPGARAPLDDADLERAFAALSRAEPAAFEGLMPLLADERRGPRSDLRGTGLRILEPRGVLDAQPHAIRWVPLAGASPYVVEVLSDEGESLIRVTQEAAQLAWPENAELREGTSYVVSVTTTVGGVRALGSAAFHRSSAADRERFARALRAIAVAQPAALRPLLRAHLAIRLRRFADAARILEDAPDDPRARRLLEETRVWLAGRSPRG